MFVFKSWGRGQEKEVQGAMETCRPEEKQPGLEMHPGDAWHTCVDASGVRAWEQLRGPGFLSEWICPSELSAFRKGRVRCAAGRLASEPGGRRLD